VWYFLIIILVIYLVVKYISKEDESQYISKSSGIQGELIISRILKNISNQVEGTTFNDIMIENNGYTCQIDTMLLTKKALYVIEFKDYSGWIFGSETNTYWKQTFTHYKARTSVNNYTNSGVGK